MRALFYVFLLAVVLSAVLRLADALVLRETTAEVIFWVLFGLGGAFVVLGEFATRHESQGSGRPSQSS